MDTPTLIGQPPNYDLQRINMLPNKHRKLFCYLVSPYRKQLIPISTLEYKVDIKLGIANITILKTYQNILDEPSDLEYIFSIPSNAAFIKMEVQFGDKLLLGLIKEKEEAKQEFQQGLNDGKTMVYSEQDAEFPDIMRVKLGNLAPQCNLKVNFQYIQPLEVCVNEFWKLSLDSIVNSRYSLGSSDKFMSYINTCINFKECNTNYSQNIQVNIDLPSALTFCKSPTHQIMNLAVKDNQRQIILDPEVQSNFTANKSFVLLFANEDIHKPQVSLTHINNDALAYQKYCATISFIPKFNPLQLDDAYQAYMAEQDLETQEFQYPQLGEYIFLIDRSGSMGGSRINKAKEALALFLRSLPQDSYFNIYSFGNKFVKLWGISQKYNQNTLNEALTYVQRMSADMGGTGILNPIQDIFMQKKQTIYPFNIFLLTDGEVTPDPIVTLVKQQCKPDTRVYTLGIGTGCSQFLIEKVAWAGNGRCHFINDNEDLNSKVIDLLQDSITPYLEQFQINTTIDSIHCMTPNPQSVVSLRKNNPFTIHILFPEQPQGIESIHLDISCYDPQSKQKLGHNCIVSMADSKENDQFHKLAALQQIQAIEETIRLKENQIRSILIRKKQIHYSDLVALSVTNQVLSRSTAFICEVAQLNDQLKQQILNNKVKILQQMHIQSPRDLNLLKKKKCRISSACMPLQQQQQLNKCSPPIPHRMAAPGMAAPRMAAPRMAAQEMTALMSTFQYQALNCLEKSSTSHSIKTKCALKSKQCMKEEKQQVDWNNKSESDDEGDMIQTTQMASKQLSYIDLINFAEADGSFNKKVGSIIPIQAKPDNIDMQYWICIVVLMYLETHFQADRGSWQLIFKKCVKYLQSNNVDYREQTKWIVIQ